MIWATLSTCCRRLFDEQRRQPSPAAVNHSAMKHATDVRAVASPLQVNCRAVIRFRCRHAVIDNRRPGVPAGWLAGISESISISAKRFFHARCNANE